MGEIMSNEKKNPDASAFTIDLADLAKDFNSEAPRLIDLNFALMLFCPQIAHPGLHPSDGFNVSVRGVSDNAGRPAYLYVVEDHLRGKMIIAGTERIPDVLRTFIEQKGVAYVDKNDPGSVAAIDNFLADGIAWREKHHLLTRTAQTRKSLLRGLSDQTGETYDRYMSVGRAIYGANRSPFQKLHPRYAASNTP
jgi:hypothetical protein